MLSINPIRTSYLGAPIIMLKINTLSANLVIVPSVGSDTSVEVFGGSPELRELLKIERYDTGVLCAFMPPAHQADKSHFPILLISVPIGTNIEVAGLRGDCEIGDVGGNVIAHQSNALSQFQVGKIASLEALVSDGAITVQGVKGDANVFISGEGKVFVQGGAIGSLKARIFHDGELDINCSVDYLEQAVAQGPNAVIRIKQTNQKKTHGEIRETWGGKVLIGPFS